VRTRDLIAKQGKRSKWRLPWWRGDAGCVRRC